jgi:hypothetical protein
MKTAFKRLIRGKSRIKTTIWGVRVPEKVKNRWVLLAGVMRVPTNHLVSYVLQDWIEQNADILTDDKARNRLADRITELYLGNK